MSLLLLGLVLAFSPVAPRAAVHPPAVARPVLLASTSMPGVTLSGTASWYRYVPGQAAAGPRLRAMLGAKWRGSQVRVCALHRCVIVRLTDWCACPERIIDLDRESFAMLAKPSLGLVKVTVDRA